MSTQSPPNRTSTPRITLKGWETMLLFLVTAVLVEILVVWYALSLGVDDSMPLQWSFAFPGKSLSTTITISPLFHLVPIAVVFTLMSSWAYLKKQIAVKPSGARRARPSVITKRAKAQKNRPSRMGSIFSRKKSAPGFQIETRPRRASLKSALIVLITFSALLLIISLLAFPGVIYQFVASSYQNNSSLDNFARGTATYLGTVFSSINNALIGAAPGFGYFAVSVGTVIAPLATLSNVGKYLFFQNVAAWTSTLIAFLYAKYGRKGLP
jgi:hypothetical protein